MMVQLIYYFFKINHSVGALNTFNKMGMNTHYSISGFEISSSKPKYIQFTMIKKSKTALETSLLLK